MLFNTGVGGGRWGIVPFVITQSPGGVNHADPTVDELNATTLYEIYPKSIEDNFFLAVPELAYFRDHCLVPFGGGSFMQAIFRYAPMIGGFYAPGTSFNIQKRTTLAAPAAVPQNTGTELSEIPTAPLRACPP